MPLLVWSNELSPGARLAEPLRSNGRVVVPAGEELTAEHIATLRREHPNALLRTCDVMLDRLAEFEDDSRERGIAAAAMGMVADQMAEVQQKFTANPSLQALGFDIARTAGSAIQFIRANPVESAPLDRDTHAVFPLAEQSGCAFFLSILLASAARDYVVQERRRQTSGGKLSSPFAADMLPLGLAAMLKDVSMFEMPHVFSAGYQLTQADRIAIAAHPNRSADLLPTTLTPTVRNIVRAHHENVDGTGYPKALVANAQHVFSRILRISDAFAAATAHRAYREAKSPARALWEMRYGPWRHCYDPVLMQTFAGLIRPFPVGSTIVLENGLGAVVVKTNPAEPFAPTVMVAFDERGDHLPLVRIGSPIQLGQTLSTRARRFGNEDVSFIYQTQPPAGPARPLPFSCLLDTAYP